MIHRHISKTALYDGASKMNTTMNANSGQINNPVIIIPNIQICGVSGSEPGSQPSTLPMNDRLSFIPVSICSIVHCNRLLTRIHNNPANYTRYPYQSIRISFMPLSNIGSTDSAGTKIIASANERTGNMGSRF